MKQKTNFGRRATIKDPSMWHGRENFCKRKAISDARGDSTEYIVGEAARSLIGKEINDTEGIGKRNYRFVIRGVYYANDYEDRYCKVDLTIKFTSNAFKGAKKARLQVKSSEKYALRHCRHNERNIRRKGRRPLSEVIVPVFFRREKFKKAMNGKPLDGKQQREEKEEIREIVKKLLRIFAEIYALEANSGNDHYMQELREKYYAPDNWPDIIML